MGVRGQGRGSRPDRALFCGVQVALAAAGDTTVKPRPGREPEPIVTAQLKRTHLNENVGITMIVTILRPKIFVKKNHGHCLHPSQRLHHLVCPTTIHVIAQQR